MTSRRRLEKLRRQLASMRRRLGNVHREELVSLATALGRTKVNRGKEPTYERQGWYPLTIPGHVKISKFTVGNILNQLEADLVALEDAEPEPEDDGEGDQ